MIAPDQEPPRRVYTIDEAAKELRVNRRTIERAIERGDLAASKRLGVWRIPAIAIAEAAGETSQRGKKAARR